MKKIIQTIPGKTYRVKTHNGLGKDCYGVGLADDDGTIRKVALDSGGFIYPTWLKPIKEAVEV